MKKVIVYIDGFNLYYGDAERHSLKVIEGFYTKHKIRMPFYKEPCVSCDKTGGMASVVKLEEKRSDVNIATEMLLDATSGATECRRDLVERASRPFALASQSKNATLWNGRLARSVLPIFA